MYGGNCKLQAEEGKGWACIVHGARKVLQSTLRLKPGKGNTTLFSSSPGGGNGTGSDFSFDCEFMS